MTRNDRPSDPALVGRVLRPHGLAGEVVVEPVGAAAACQPGDRFWMAGDWRRVTRCRFDSKGRWLLGLDGVSGRDAAEALRGAELLVEADDLPALEPDSYYVHELIGCRVENADGSELGEVVAVVPGPQDLLEIERGGRRSLLPMARGLLKEVDLTGRRIVVDMPPGLDEATSS